MRLTMSLATIIIPESCDIVKQHCVRPPPFRMSYPNGAKAQPSIVDRGGQGLSFQPLDNPIGQDLVTHKAGRRHGYGGCIQAH